MVKKKAQKGKSAHVPPDFWVGLGASAGGLEALRGFVRHLPFGLPATFIVAQHISPNYRSMLTEIIGRETDIPVVEVVDGVVAEANTIFITPPNANVTIDGDVLRLTEPDVTMATPKPSVNLLLKSLADSKRDRAVGIVLSGTGSDGSTGIRAIRNGGGITIAQDELTAKYASMPASAVETGLVDLVMAPEEIGAQFRKIIKVPRDLQALRASPMNMDSVSELMRLLHDETKVDFRHYKTATFQRRVERRIAATRAKNLEEYVSIASGDPSEVQELFQDLLITVTSFFRDPDEFEELRRYIRKIVENNNDGPIRIWVPGVATGEEAFTIAIILADELGGLAKFAAARVQIFATDVDANAIEVARRGYYSERSLAEIPIKAATEYFEKAPGGFNISKMIREKIVFSVHNIAEDPPFLNVDLISCRNLLIYFQPQLQAQVFARFQYALKPRGILFLGKSESVTGKDNMFQPSGTSNHIFIQRPGTTDRRMRDPQYRNATRAAPKQSSSYPPPEARELENVQAQLDSLISAVGPNSLWVTEDLHITRAFGDVGPYLGISQGRISTTVSSLIKEPYRQMVKAAIPSVVRNGETFSGTVRDLERSDVNPVRISIYPISGAEKEDTSALVVFEAVDEVALTDGAAMDDDIAYRDQVNQLNNELSLARSSLTRMIEELETSNEELQALNEELQSSNEELQSTNEEMETSNEELQSTNEELSTVNEELQVNAQLLNMVNESLRSVLQNIAIPLLVVDRDLNITHSSHASEEIFGLSQDMTLPHVSRCKLPSGFPSLVPLLDEAMASSKNVTRHIATDEHNGTLLIAPHFSNAKELMGGIIVMSDNTAELRHTRDELQLIFDNLPASILVRSTDGEILKANKVSSQFFKIPAEKLAGTNFAEYCQPDEWKLINGLDMESANQGKIIENKLVPFTGNTGTKRILSTSRIPSTNPDTGETVIYAMALDVTEQHTATELLKLSESRYEEAARIADLGHWEWNLETDANYWSAHLETMLGMEPGTFGNHFNDFAVRVHPEDSERVQSLLEKHRHITDPFKLRFRIRHENGSYIWFEGQGATALGEDGKPSVMSGTVQDVSEVVEFEQSLKERNSQFELASQIVSLGYWRSHPDEGLFWSDEMYRIHGVDPESFELTAENAINAIHPDDRDAFASARGAVKPPSDHFRHEMRIVRPNGDVRTVRILAEGSHDRNGHYAFAYGTLQDITEEVKSAEELTKTNLQLSLASQMVSLGYWRIEVASRLAFWSDELHSIYGTEPGGTDLAMDRMFSTFDSPDVALAKQDIEGAIKTGASFSCEFRIKRADGKVRHLSLNGTPQIDKSGRITHIFGASLDVTHDREARNALKESELRLGHAVQASGLGFWELDTDSKEIFWSKRFREMVGADIEKPHVLVKDFRAQIHKDDLPAVEVLDAKFFKDRDYNESEFRLRHEDGRYIWLKSSARMFPTNDGSGHRIIGTTEDITARTLATAQMHEFNRQLNFASQIAGFGYWRVDLVDGGLYWSDQVYEIHGLSPDTYTPKVDTALSLYHPDDVDRVSKHVADAVEKFEPFEFEARIIRSDGAVRTVISKGSVEQQDEKSPVALFGVFRDITEERERETELVAILDELSRSNEELNRFSYVCSHDMKEPVRTIENMTKLLLQPEIQDDPEQRDELLTRINKNMLRLRGIIDSLLAYSRVEAKVDLREVDLTDVLNEIIESLSLSIEDNGAKITFGKMPSLFGARVHFVQLFQNLIGNALKYSDSAKPRIKLSSVTRKNDFVIRVEDNGPGVPEAGRETVFEMFGRLQAPAKTDGAGLGLSICKRIVDQYNGNIVCKDSKLGGAMFEITLPKRHEETNA